MNFSGGESHRPGDVWLLHGGSVKTYAQEQQQKHSSSDSKMPSGVPWYWWSEQCRVEWLQISTFTEEGHCFFPCRGKGIGGGTPFSLQPSATPSLWKSHLVISSISLFPKCTRCSLYRCHVAHGIRSWGKQYTHFSCSTDINSVCSLHSRSPFLVQWCHYCKYQ